MPKRFLGFVLASLLAAPALAQDPANLSAPLPVDTSVTIGVLPNGLHYYIRRNAKPEKRAELRLVVNAGSILEDSTQLGLAHFIEHTAFNGTTNFRKNDLVSYLESIGVRFGADLNASTSFDETVYILPVPTDTPKIVDRAFQILEDWAHGQVFDPTEVTNERGVVLEEWRGRKGAGDRMLQQWLPIALKGSLYASRIPIGTDKSIMTATPERLRKFYQDWYRPDLMAVIAVGDFDKSAIEGLIRKHFASIPKAVNPRPRVNATVPPNTEPLVAIATDKEATSTSVNIIYKLAPEQTKTLADYKRDLTQRLYLSMLNNRLQEITEKPDAPFVGAGASKGSFLARSQDAFTLAAGAKEGMIDTAIVALLNEARRVDQFGFLDSELGRAKTAMLRGYEMAYTERNKTSSAALVGEYIGNFLLGEAIPGIEYEYRAVQALLPTITLADVNTLARDWIRDDDRVIIVQAPQKEGLRTPTEQDILSLFDRAAKVALTPYTETLAADPLMSPLPEPGNVVASKSYPSIGVTEWKLSNGARVLIKPTDFKADEVLFSARSPGGASLVSDADYISAALSQFVVSTGGLGKFNQIDLRKKLAGKVAAVSGGVGDYSESLNGRASPKDLETFLQLINLNITAPRLDTTAFRAFSNQIAQFLKNQGQNPEAVYSDTIAVTMSQHHPREPLFNEATFAKLDPVRAMELYRQRFADVSDFTFYFVGSIDTTTLKPLVERYLASLPALNRKETWKDMGKRLPTGVVEKIVHKGKEPKAQTDILFTGPFAYNPQNRLVLRALGELAQMRAIEVLREQLGGTYSPSVETSTPRIPVSTYSIDFSYGSAPENVDKLTKSVFGIVDSLKARPATAAELTKVKEQIIRSREVDLKTNAFWIGNIESRDEAGEDITGLTGAYDAMLQNLTAAQIQAAAKLYFNTKNYARFVLLPDIVQ
jgi:zinc protease